MKTSLNGTARASTTRSTRDLIHLEELNALATLLRKAVGSTKDDGKHRRLRYADTATAKS